MKSDDDRLGEFRDRFCLQGGDFEAIRDHTDVLAAARSMIERLSERLALVEERLSLARGALCRTYFAPHEVGDDVAPRIIEMWSALTKGSQ